MRLAWLLLLVAACKADGGDDDFPVTPGGGGGGGGSGGGGVDAPPRDGDADAGIDGRVCVVIDLRRWTTGCASSGVDGLTVTLGGASAQTMGDGSFRIVPPAPTGTLVVSGPEIVTSLHPYNDQSSITIAAPRRDYWDDVLINNSIVVTDGNGSAIVGFAAADVVAVSNPQPGAIIHYDGNDATIWDIDATGQLGIALLPDLQTGGVTVTGLRGADAVDVQVVVAEDALSFGRGVLP